MRLISDGVADREGSRRLAARIGYTPRHFHPRAHCRARRRPAQFLARAKRSVTARAHRDHGPRVRRHRLRRRVPRACDSSTTRARGLRQSDRTCVDGAAAGVRPSGDDALRRADAVRRARGCATSSLYHLVPGVELATAGGMPALRSAARPRHGVARTSLTRLDPVRSACHHAHFVLTDLRVTRIAAVERARRPLDADCDPLAVSRPLLPATWWSASARPA